MFVGLKMLLTDAYKIPVIVSLAVICTILASSIAASVVAVGGFRAMRALPRHAEAEVLPRGEVGEAGRVRMQVPGSTVDAAVPSTAPD
jgi:hypothetical protein